MRSTSTFTNYFSSVRALTTYGLPERSALRHCGSLPNSEEGDAVADSLADLGWIIGRTLEGFDFGRAELHALISLTADTYACSPADCAQLMLKLDVLDHDRAEDADPVEPRMLGGLMAKMVAMSETQRLFLYPMLMQAQSRTADMDEALRAVGLLL